MGGGKTPGDEQHRVIMGTAVSAASTSTPLTTVDVPSLVHWAFLDFPLPYL